MDRGIVESDYNEVLKPGMYSIFNTVDRFPNSPNGDYGILVVFHSSYTNYIAQAAFFVGGVLQFRVRNQADYWSTWNTVSLT